MSVLVSILYNPFTRDFLHKVSAAIPFDNKDIYMLGDFNITLRHGRKYIFQGNSQIYQWKDSYDVNI